MAILYSNVGAKQNAPTNKSPLGPIEVAPAHRKLILSYTMTGAEVANDVVKLYKLPANSIVIPRGSLVVSDAIAATATITVGDHDLNDNALDADRYSTALNVAAAGDDSFTGGVAATTPFTTTSESWLTFTFATLATPTAGKRLDFYVEVNQAR